MRKTNPISSGGGGQSCPAPRPSGLGPRAKDEMRKTNPISRLRMSAGPLPPQGRQLRDPPGAESSAPKAPRIVEVYSFASES
jgi:hypothetical protein